MARRDEPKRWSALDETVSRPSGRFAMGVPDEVATVIGVYAVAFAHLEAQMMTVLGEALGDPSWEIAQPIWSALGSNHSRIKFMRDVLRDHPKASQLDGEADALVERFSKLCPRRNAFIHGLWHYETERKELWLTSKLDRSGTPWIFQPSEGVQLQDVLDATDAVVKLTSDVCKWHLSQILGRQAANMASRNQSGFPGQ